MKRAVWMGVAVVAIVAIAILVTRGGPAGDAALASTAGAQEIPQYQVDPSWPVIPNNWVFGQVSGLAAGPDGDIWVLQRPRTAAGLGRDASRVAPAVVRFDPQGNFITAWGGPDYVADTRFEWPAQEHGIAVDYRGNVWLAGHGGGQTPDNQILKFTGDGEFIMQIGHRAQSQGNLDTQNVNRAADVYVHQETNEAFIADGYGNRRIIVYDADTGAYKRMWGAFGNQPADPVEGEDRWDPNHFHLVHSVRISRDGNVYVADREGMRLWVFRPEGTYVTHKPMGQYQNPDPAYVASRANDMAFGAPVAELIQATADAHWSVSRTAFSPDAEQRWLFVAERSNHQIVVLDRQSLTELTHFGQHGNEPGEFYVLHDMVADPQGNIYTAEVNDGSRAQKFTYMGVVASAQ
jgi:DNA-binding beta-propeller fold protein YncE